MLRLAPAGCEGEEVGVGVGVGEDGTDGDGLDSVEQSPFETRMPVLAPAVCRTMSGTQEAPSRLYEYGMLTLVVDVGFGPAGLFSLPFADQVTLSKMLPATCQ